MHKVAAKLARTISKRGKKDEQQPQQSNAETKPAGPAQGAQNLRRIFRYRETSPSRMITSFFQAKTKPTKKKASPAAPSGAGDTPTTKRERDDKKETEEAEGEGSNKRVKTDKLENSVKELLLLLGSDEGSEERTWYSELGKCFRTPSFQRLATFVSKERESNTIFPPVEDTFSALNLTPLDQVKVVIVGQDPYHGEGQAHGLCFSVRKGIKIPPSLRNIYKELLNDPDVPDFDVMPKHGYLERWARQGVLMINAVLTVRSAKPNSHQNKGWEAVTDEIIRAVDRRSKATGKGVVFLLWGKPATLKATTALGGSSKQHKIICSSHPSPLGATKTNAPFMGSRCFSKANEALREFGYEEVIDWRVDGPLPVRHVPSEAANDKDD